MTWKDDDEDMAVLLTEPPERIWFYTEDAIWFAVSERAAMAMTKRLVGPYVLEDSSVPR